MRGHRAAGRRASRTCRAWRSRQRYWSRRPRRTIWATRCLMRGLRGGTRAACASNSTAASCGARSAGRAGRRTWAGRGEQARCMAMTELGNGLCDAGHDEDALSVREADLHAVATWSHQISTCSLCRAMLRSHMKSWADRKAAMSLTRLSRMFEAPRRGTMWKPSERPTTTRITLLQGLSATKNKEIARKESPPPVARRVAGEDIDGTSK